jgi:hypothetical protein
MFSSASAAVSERLRSHVYPLRAGLRHRIARDRRVRRARAATSSSSRAQRKTRRVQRRASCGPCDLGLTHHLGGGSRNRYLVDRSRGGRSTHYALAGSRLVVARQEDLEAPPRVRTPSRRTTAGLPPARTHGNSRPGGHFGAAAARLAVESEAAAPRGHAGVPARFGELTRARRAGSSRGPAGRAAARARASRALARLLRGALAVRRPPPPVSGARRALSALDPSPFSRGATRRRIGRGQTALSPGPIRPLRARSCASSSHGGVSAVVWGVSGEWKMDG